MPKSSLKIHWALGIRHWALGIKSDSILRRAALIRRDRVLHEALDLARRARAGGSRDLSPAMHHRHRRNRADAEARGELRLRVGIHLHDQIATGGRSRK